MNKITTNHLHKFVLIAVIVTSWTALRAQTSQYIGRVCYNSTYDPKTKTYVGSDQEEAFECRISVDYNAKSVKVYNLMLGVDFLEAKWTKEQEGQDFNNATTYFFDPKKNTSKLKEMMIIWFGGEGYYTFDFLFADKRINLPGVEADDNLNDIGDVTEMNAAVKPIYFRNTTSYNVYISTKVLPSKNADWTVNDFVKIGPGMTEQVGENTESYFYYYAYCKNSKGEYVIWEGTDDNNKVGAHGPYGFKMLNMDVDGYLLEDQSWCYNISLPFKPKTFIIGDGVRIRSEGNVKGKEISKVYGYREVELVETSSNRDNLGTKDPCHLYKWFKVKWAGDSTGWVYGAYYFNSTSNQEWATFEVDGNEFKAFTYINPDQPAWGDDEGAFGCSGITTYVVMYSPSTDKYHMVKDGIAKKTRYLDIDQYAGASIEKIEVNYTTILLYVDYDTQDQIGKHVYKISYKNGQFSVISFV